MARLVPAGMRQVDVMQHLLSVVAEIQPAKLNLTDNFPDPSHRSAS